jgi:hypothetical protein
LSRWWSPLILDWRLTVGDFHVRCWFTAQFGFGSNDKASKFIGTIASGKGNKDALFTGDDEEEEDEVREYVRAHGFQRQAGHRGCYAMLRCKCFWLPLWPHCGLSTAACITHRHPQADDTDKVTDFFGRADAKLDALESGG